MRSGISLLCLCASGRGLVHKPIPLFWGGTVAQILAFFLLLAGATNAIRVDLTCNARPDLQATAIYAHENLEPCVGESIAAFGAAILSDAVSKGVWFPEEAIAAGTDAAAVLGMASVGTHTTSVSSTSWSGP